MCELELIERSLMLGYALGFDSETETYIVFCSFVSNEVAKVINSALEYYPTTRVMIVSDERQAKLISDSPQWLNAIAELGA